MDKTINISPIASPRDARISPFLAKAGISRTGADQLPGYYCEQQQMWVIDTDRGALPIINEQALSQLQTKTRVSEEGDDDTIFALELMTKTNLQIESDDDIQPAAHNSLLQLTTKTDSIQEVDDSSWASELLGLVTKTYVKQEEDDDGFDC